MATLIVPDVNVLVGAFHRDLATHEADRAWLHDRLDRREPLGLAEPVLLGLLRVATHPRVFASPAPTQAVVEFIEELVQAPSVRSLPTTGSVWARFRDLASADPHVRGNLIPDAWIAALALAHGGAVATRDRGFRRFDGLDLLLLDE